MPEEVASSKTAACWHLEGFHSAVFGSLGGGLCTIVLARVGGCQQMLSAGGTAAKAGHTPICPRCCAEGWCHAHSQVGSVQRLQVISGPGRL